MLRDFFRRRNSTPAVTPSPASTPAARVDAPVDAPALAPRAEREVTDVAAWLALEVEHRVAAVRDTLSTYDRGTDAPAFLDGLTGSFAAVVRQPPLAAQRALSVTRDPRSSASKLVGLVETDPGLSQGLLQYANSAFYASTGGRCVSLMNAVHRVGTSGVHNVVLRTMVDGLLCRPGGQFQAWVDLTWEHMVRVAPVAHGLARPFGVHPDEAYMLGLLHDVGKLVAFDRMGELRRTLRREVRIPPAITSILLRFLHEPLGGLAALQWGLGAQVAHAIATHRRAPLPEIHDARCELIFLAEKLDLWRAGPAGSDGPPPVEEWCRDGALNVPATTLIPLVDELLQPSPDVVG